MKFGLAVNFSIEIINKSDYAQSLSNDLEGYFKHRTYGDDIKTYTIGVVCVSPQFDAFYQKEIKPKYTRGKKVISPDDIRFELEDNFEYRIKINYESFKNATAYEAKRILAKEILASFALLEKYKAKIKSFDWVSFQMDLEKFFRSQHLI